VVYGEGRYRCEEHGLVRPEPRTQGRLAAGAFEPTCPFCHRSLASEAVPEDARIDPRNVYAATKAQQEQLCAAFARETGAAVIALRYHNVYGPRMPRDTPYAGVASIFRSALEGGRAPQVFEDGGQLRDFVHVRDVAAANVLALGSAATGAFNVASGAPHTVGELAAELSAAFGGEEAVTTGEYRLGDVRHVFASTERAAAELGFRAKVSFADGVRELATASLR
ncbi:MAG: NAD-dependent epimerase/dehydratase family protein, partial [Gaiellaceae bacterium]